jgi:hypothetical protein
MCYEPKGHDRPSRYGSNVGIRGIGYNVVNRRVGREPLRSENITRRSHILAGVFVVVLHQVLPSWRDVLCGAMQRYVCCELWLSMTPRWGSIGHKYPITPYADTESLGISCRYAMAATLYPSLRVPVNRGGEHWGYIHWSQAVSQQKILIEIGLNLVIWGSLLRTVGWDLESHHVTDVKYWSFVYCQWRLILSRWCY